MKTSKSPCSLFSVHTLAEEKNGRVQLEVNLQRQINADDFYSNFFRIPKAMLQKATLQR